MSNIYSEDNPWPPNSVAVRVSNPPTLTRVAVQATLSSQGIQSTSNPQVSAPASRALQGMYVYMWTYIYTRGREKRNRRKSNLLKLLPTKGRVFRARTAPKLTQALRIQVRSREVVLDVVELGVGVAEAVLGAVKATHAAEGSADKRVRASLVGRCLPEHAASESEALSI